MQIIDGKLIYWSGVDSWVNGSDVGVDTKHFPEYLQVRGRNEVKTFRRAQTKGSGFEYRFVTNMGAVIAFTMY